MDSHVIYRTIYAGNGYYVYVGTYTHDVAILACGKKNLTTVDRMFFLLKRIVVFPNDRLTAESNAFHGVRKNHHRLTGKPDCDTQLLCLAMNYAINQLQTRVIVPA